LAERLQDLLRHLDGYEFVTPTPATHERYLQRNRRTARDVRDVLGWNLPFEPEILPRGLLEALKGADFLSAAEGGLLRSRIRVSTLGGRRFIHSAYPTDEQQSVFFGPDSYRFAAFLRAQLPKAHHPLRLVDMGAGSGVGGIVAASLVPGARISMVDVNPRALLFASVNAADAGITAELVEASSLAGVGGPVDLVIANPPYIMDEAQRAYRHGGAMHGAQLSLDWALEAGERLAPGGTMLLYTGTAILAGHDQLKEALAGELPRLGCTFRYDEIDPDVFGEELDEPQYREVERIAVVGVVITKRG
jgi:methylase of polypeptide subunit release factors